MHRIKRTQNYSKNYFLSLIINHVRVNYAVQDFSLIPRLAISLFLLLSIPLYPLPPGDKCDLIDESPTESESVVVTPITPRRRRQQALSSRLAEINQELLLDQNHSPS